MNHAAAPPALADSPHRINASWLVRLRWGAVLGQLVTITVVHRFMGIPLALTPLLTLIAVEAVTNLFAALWLRAGRPVHEWSLPLMLGLDVAILTGLLFFTGGSFNPFSFLYLVHIALAAVVLRSGWTWALVALSLLCSGGLFYGDVWLQPNRPDPASHMQHMRMHLEGMWIAFAVAAGFIVYFVTRIRRALALREADLQAQRAVATRHERLASLATLAAGAAHELATPLGTIAVVVRELERQAEREGSGDAEDLRLIRAQVDRCRGILDQMAADAGESAGEPIRSSRLADIMAAALDHLPAAPAVTVDVQGPAEASVELPVRAMAQALRGIVKNAQEAAGPQGQVSVELQSTADDVHVLVRDNGPGMPAETLARAGEPFFTTKEPGRGMGLGLFLARTVVERFGGRLAVTSRAGRGTTVSVILPAAAAAKHHMANGA